MPREASRFSVAAVRPDSDLPQLDRDFDYEIPEEYRNAIGVGSEVSVRLGKGSNPVRGFVTHLKSQSEFKGALSQIEDCSPFPMITPELMQLCENLAKRRACNLAEILKLVVPLPAVRAAAKLALNQSNLAIAIPSGEELSPEQESRADARIATAVECSLSGFAEYFEIQAENAKQRASLGESTLVLVADERTQELVRDIFSANGVLVTHYSSSLTRTQRYEAYTGLLTGKSLVIIGGRAASLLPLKKLSKVVVWDEGDPRFVDRASPYLSVREVVALRQQLQGFNVDYAGSVPSTSLARWISTGFVKLIGNYQTSLRISFQESPTKFGRQAVDAIRESISATRNALVVVATPGFTDVFYCSACNARAACRFCSGSIRAISENQYACRVCNAPEPRLICRTCSSLEFDSGAGGASRVSQELGKIFPGTPIMESTGTTPLKIVQKTGAIVVSTNGVVPFDERGYGAVVFLEATRYLRREGFYAREEAYRIWAHTLNFAERGARVVFEGVPQQLGQSLSLWNQMQLAEDELRDRRELGFPPINRMASVTGGIDTIELLADSLSNFEGIKVLGVTSVDDSKAQVSREGKVVISYPHRLALELASRLREEQLKLAGTVLKNKRSGRAVRPLRINMDDMKVI